MKVKNEFMNRRIFGGVIAIIVSFLCSVILFQFNYLERSAAILGLLSLGTVVLFFLFYWLLNTNHSRFQPSNHKKDSKLLIIMCSSFFLFSVTIYPFYRDVATSMVYNNINNSIVNSYDKKIPNTLNYMNFKKDMDDNNEKKIAYYNSHIDDFMSVDTNVLISLMMVKDNIKNVDIKNKIEKIYTDKYISKNEYNELKKYILDTDTDDLSLAQIVSR